MISRNQISWGVPILSRVSGKLSAKRSREADPEASEETFPSEWYAYPSSSPDTSPLKQAQ